MCSNGEKGGLLGTELGQERPWWVVSKRTGNLHEAKAANIKKTDSERSGSEMWRNDKKRGQKEMILPLKGRGADRWSLMDF